MARKRKQNWCGDMTADQIRKALGISKSTYYHYVGEPDYPRGAALEVQQAWVEKRRGGGDQGDDSAPVVRPRQPKSASHQEWEERKLRAQALEAEHRLQRTIDETLRVGEIIMTQKLIRIVDRLGTIIKQQVCDECSRRLAAEYDRTKAELDAHIQELER